MDHYSESRLAGSRIFMLAPSVDTEKVDAILTERKDEFFGRYQNLTRKFASLDTRNLLLTGTFKVIVNEHIIDNDPAASAEFDCIVKGLKEVIDECVIDVEL